MILKRLTTVLCSCVCLCILSTFSANAQQKNTTSSVVPASMKQLLADQVKINKEKLRLDSLQIDDESEEEGDLYPALNLYDDNWNATTVNPYGRNAQIPDSIKIDCSDWYMPSMGHVTSKFGPRRRRYHYGIDIKVQVGDPIFAAFDGKVRVVSTARGYGKFMVVRHNNGLETVYAHLSGFVAERDQEVKAGEMIAYGGNTGRSTGSHLHFETRLLGVPINPSEIFDFENKVAHRDTYTFYRKSGRMSTTPYGVSYAQAKSSTTHKENSRIAYHKVRSGDTLGRIAQIYGVSVSKLCEINKISKTSTLRIGQVLRTS